MYDIITFGSATRDVFLKSKMFKVLAEKNFLTGAGLCMTLGSKIDAEEIFFSSGGGGTNAAATFAKQGLKVAYCGAVGEDISGREIIEELKELGIDTQFILKTKKSETNHSIILSSGGKDRTILIYRGASGLLQKKDIHWQKLKARWFYLGPLSGELSKITEDIIDFAHKNKIKIALNPGNSQLSLPPEILKRILRKIDILILNQEEASLLAKIPYNQEKEIFKKIDGLCPGIVIMTKGPGGMVASDNRYLYRAKPPKTKVVDRTGAGDSFASGFLSGYIHSNSNIEEAIQLGIANSTACLSKLGAKNGLLAKGAKFEPVKIKKEFCGNK